MYVQHRPSRGCYLQTLQRKGRNPNSSAMSLLRGTAVKDDRRHKEGKVRGCLQEQIGNCKPVLSI